MIFVSVGSQLPFDRLTRAVAEWAEAQGRTDEVFYQIGDGIPPTRGTWVRQLTPVEFEKRCREAELVVSHAGTGILIVTSANQRKLLVFPRRFSEPGEVRNDHQMDSAHHWVENRIATVAFSVEELYACLNDPERILIPQTESPETKNLMDSVRSFVHTGTLPPPKKRMFDGIVCLGGPNYWYSSGEHCDIRLVEELARCVPVLYINSIGVRTPSTNGKVMLWKQIRWPLKRFSHRIVCVGNKYLVMDTLALSMLYRTAFGRRFFAWQVRRAAQKMGIRNALLWVASGQTLYYIDHLKFDSFVYQRSDRMELYPGAPRNKIVQFDRAAKAAADVTLFCASSLLEQEGTDCRDATFVDHGVDYESFSAAGRAVDELDYTGPDDLKDIPHPRVGYVGSLNACKFDSKLLVDLARRRPDIHFVMVGRDSLPSGWCTEPNVHFLGPRPHADVPPYMAGCDVLMIPYLQNSPWVEACNPLKMKEYLAVGRPIISVPFFELKNCEGLITVARSVGEWSQALNDALRLEAHSSRMVARRRAQVENETWRHKAQRVLVYLAERGIHPYVPS